MPSSINRKFELVFALALCTYDTNPYRCERINIEKYKQMIATAEKEKKKD